MENMEWLREVAKGFRKRKAAMKEQEENDVKALSKKWETVDADAGFFDSKKSVDLSKVVGGGKGPSEVVDALKNKYKRGGYENIMDDPEARRIKKRIETGNFRDY